jgi:hypothetical protein
MKRKLKMSAAALLVSGAVTAVALAASSPAVVTGHANHISDSSAVLNGTVNPNGADTTYYFRWGLTTAYGVNGKPVSAGSGTKSVSVQETAGGLIPGTTYHYQLVATNRFGTSVGSDRTFATTGHPPPDVATGPATQIGSTSATVTGVVNPHNQSTTYYFEWGLSTSYGFQTATGTVNPGNAPVNVAATFQGLDPGTIFHYRIVATHGGAATSYGNDGTFMTYPAHRPVPGVRAGTRPRHARHRPYVLTTSGSVAPPASIPATYACSGNVVVRFMNGSRQAGLTFVGLQPDCRFTAKTVFKHLPRHPRGTHQVTLRIVVRFLGNGYLAPNASSSGRVTLG